METENSFLGQWAQYLKKTKHEPRFLFGTEDMSYYLLFCIWVYIPDEDVLNVIESLNKSEASVCSTLSTPNKIKVKYRIENPWKQAWKSTCKKALWQKSEMTNSFAHSTSLSWHTKLLP